MTVLYAFFRADFLDDFETVESVELDVFLCNHVLHCRRKFCVHLFGFPLRVEKERAAVFKVGEHVVTKHVGFVVASHEVGLVDEVSASDGLVAETQVGDCDTARLFGVVCKVCLRVFVGVVADDFDGVLVCADGAVRAETVELARDCACVGCVDLFGDVQGMESDVVVDADGESVFLFTAHVLVDCVDHGGIEFLAAETVTTAEHFFLYACFVECGHDVEVERFALCARLFGSVHNRDNFCGCGDGFDECVLREGAIKSDFQKADFVSSCVEVVNGFFNGFRARTHDDDHAIRIGCAVVVDEVVFSSCERADFVHLRLNDCGDSVIVFVACFSVLEVDVGVLSRALLMRMLGVESACAELVHFLEIDERLDFVVFDDVDFVNFVRGAETVEEVEERNAGFDCGKIGHESEVHNFLHAVCSEHSKTGLTACHNVRVIAEDVECVTRYASCGYVKHARKQFARNFVHVGDHEQQALACRERARQSTCRQRTVNRTCSACFGLHFGNFKNVAKRFFLPWPAQSSQFSAMGDDGVIG